MRVVDQIVYPENWTRHVLELHDDVITWKHFPRYWPFVRGIHRSPVNSKQRGQWRGALVFSLICARLSKQWRGWWFETPSRPLWHHCNGSLPMAEQDMSWLPEIPLRSKLCLSLQNINMPFPQSNVSLHNVFIIKQLIRDASLQVYFRKLRNFNYYIHGVCKKTTADAWRSNYYILQEYNRLSDSVLYTSLGRGLFYWHLLTFFQ